MDNLRTVEELCAEHGFDIAKLAALSSLDEKRILAIVEGRWTPSPAERDKIAGVFKLTREQIAWGHKSIISNIQGHGPQFGRSP
ncbi:MAG: hypothetical protein EXR98_21580 [Gemmataceae bacterium]|nr:hypothetical protein [Gemmataceae bacterium]